MAADSLPAGWGPAGPASQSVSCEDTSVSSIWTPSGEYQPNDEPDGAPAGPPAGADSGDPGGAGGRGGPGEGDITPEELEAMGRLHDQLRATPAIDVVANHVVQLFQLALVYLGAGVGGADEASGAPMADLVQASIVVDAMAAIVDGLGPRLGDHEQTLRDALTQLQLLWVEIADESNG
jgi:hypothetical protein